MAKIAGSRVQVRIADQPLEKLESEMSRALSLTDANLCEAPDPHKTD